MINEPMDDDGEDLTIPPEWDETVSFEHLNGLEEPDLDPVMEPDPPGTMRKEFSGASVLMRLPAPAQVKALMRGWELAIKRTKALDPKRGQEALDEAYAISEKFDVRILDFIESLIVDPDDVDRLLDLQIVGKLSPSSMLSVVLDLRPEPQDDVAPEPAKPKKKPNPIKRAANVRRTQK
jgi:hypothetical protein